MILADTSAWIELLSGRVERPTADQLSQFVTSRADCAGTAARFARGTGQRGISRSLLAIPCLSDPLPLGLFLEAADIYREGRRKGHTIRSTIDCLIAMIAIDNGIEIWHRDRDYDAIAKFTPLRVAQRIPPRVQ